MPTLDWIGKNKVVNHHLDVPFKVLEKKYTFTKEGEVSPSLQPASRSYATPSAGTPRNAPMVEPVETTCSENKIIHGDNLEALKALLPEYEGRIKCIYIDPPYNTGNEAWVYNDNVNDPKIKKWLGEVVGKESEDLTRHDKWLCMMYPRLKLLHKLLSEDGAIFISIDDNEQANLKLICDEIFGSGNAIGPFIQLKRNTKNDAKNIQKNHEYILVYRKNEIYHDNGKLKETLINKSSDEKEVFNENGEYYYLNDSITTRGEGGTLNARPNLGYTIYYNTELDDFIPELDYDIEKAKILNDELEIYKTNGDYINKGYIPIRPPRVRGVLGAWTWELAKIQKDKKFIKITGKKGKFAVHKRTFVNKESVYEKDGRFFINIKTIENSRSILDFSTKDGTTEFDTIMGKSGIFDNPKNISMIEYLINIATDRDSIILDSFAGSGTTAHAVLNLNKKDGGNRRFILIEMMDYAETITAERVKRVITGYEKDNTTREFAKGKLGKQETESLLRRTDGSFSFYELGAPLLIKGFLNEEVDIQRIREYIWYTETGNASLSPFTQYDSAENHFLGKHFNTGYWFYYKRNVPTTLDFSFLQKLKQKCEQYIIYADICLLPQDFMQKNNIIFKKIPRDIKRF